MPLITIIVAPGGKLGLNETTNPIKTKENPKITATIIIFDGDFVNNLAIAAGKVNNEITKIKPTILINTTIVTAITIKRNIYKKFVFKPRNFANSSSKEMAINCLKKTNIAVKTNIFRNKRIHKSDLLTNKIFPNKNEIISVL